MLIKHNGKYYRDKTEITSEQYNEILTMLRNRPTAPDGYGYRLTESLEWELYELPTEEGEEDATEVDYLEALAELGVTDEES
jgi:hypothetical protein